MKLTYRGVNYDYNPTFVETSEGKVGGKYRGMDWRFRNLKKPPVIQPTKNLTYRGVSYQVGQTSSDKSVKVGKIPALSTQDKARVLMMDRTRINRNRQEAMLSRSAAEIGLNHDFA
ncbi:MAG: DUF4278 domain-containing protein [Oscillatoria sp. PMC 1051.18]|uniref:DUF4278 domain-containing protein n=1 Tax=Oscillatoria salina TaxID=331517 RepID=UPI0013BA7682|nr:DUF4278 domain-containing protein [Oscillatoria salina]MBZ8180902.1 DUF4278 domain-containing protein [Oscillatoria salina IIICB1]MEC4893926.1 DUF4278 domain-containing protein [Oscillatoria sp. PMC 1050.18]MEC5030383.1 DUF4278 domain-containing protein [Oscillatoria sp. PMC 1051.18]NET91329.1 DUF4278 domain-containing protein [Kamptonema sp. SIO1D9]